MSRGEPLAEAFEVTLPFDSPADVVARLDYKRCLAMAPPGIEVGSSLGFSKDSVKGLMALARVVFGSNPRSQEVPCCGNDSEASPGKIPFRGVGLMLDGGDNSLDLQASVRSPGFSHLGQRTRLSEGLSIILPAEPERRAALTSLSEQLCETPLGRCWWSSLQFSPGPSSGLRRGSLSMILPDCVGPSVLLTDGSLEQAVISVGVGKALEVRGVGHSLVLPTCQKARLSLEPGLGVAPVGCAVARGHGLPLAWSSVRPASGPYRQDFRTVHVVFVGFSC